MRSIALNACLLVAMTMIATGERISTVAGAESAPIDYHKQVLPVLKTHCFKCHGESKAKGDLRLDSLGEDFTSDRRSAERWHDVLEAVNLGEMPPDDQPELTSVERQAITLWIEQQTNALIASTQSTAGRVVLRRLNRVEYQNTMRDLLGIDTDYVEHLPPEGLSADGFRNNGQILRMSAMQLESYLAAARAGLRKAIVSGPKPQVVHHEFTKSETDKGRGSNILNDDERFVAKLMEYPSEGEFVIRVRAKAKLVDDRGYPLLRAAVGFRADVQAPVTYMTPVDVESEDFQEFEFRDRIEHFPLPSKTQSKFPGLLVWLDNAYAEGADKPLKAKRQAKKKKNKKSKGEPKKPVPLPVTPNYPLIEIESVEFHGPIFETWPPRHHTAILFPSELKEQDERAYVDEVLKRFLARAFRRPVNEGDLVPYQQFFQRIRKTTPSLENAITETLAMALVSPDFLYLFEPAKTKRSLTDGELASRLSYFLWSTMPDTELVERAQAGALRDPQVMREQVERLIANPQSWQFVEQFANQWLDLGAIERVAVNPEYYPDFDNALKPAMRDETLQFFAEVFYNDLSSLNFLESDFTMLNEPLAKHYGLSGPRGSGFERVELTDTAKRGGLLAHGSVLLGNSTGNDSHVVKRAVWIRERLLDDPPSDPPPNVPSLDSTNPDFASLPVRDQLRLHRNDPACNDCHRGIDPWGIALENYGADGLWRDEILRQKPKGKRMHSVKVSANSTLPDGSEISGIKSLKSYLVAERSDQFARAFTTKLLTYALGRSLELTDEPVVQQLSTGFIQSDCRIDQLVHAIVASETFQTK